MKKLLMTILAACMLTLVGCGSLVPDVDVDVPPVTINLPREDITLPSNIDSCYYYVGEDSIPRIVIESEGYELVIQISNPVPVSPNLSLELDCYIEGAE